MTDSSAAQVVTLGEGVLLSIIITPLSGIFTGYIGVDVRTTRGEFEPFHFVSKRGTDYPRQRILRLVEELGERPDTQDLLRGLLDEVFP